MNNKQAMDETIRNITDMMSNIQNSLYSGNLTLGQAKSIEDKVWKAEKVLNEKT